MRYKIFTVICLTLLFLTGCGVLRNKEKIKTSSEQTEIVSETTIVKDLTETKTTGKELNTEKNKQVEGKEGYLQVKGELEVIEDVVLQEGLNVLKTESGGTVFVVKDKEDKVSLIINRPDINVFNKDFSLVEEVRGQLKDSSETLLQDNSSEYSIESLKDTSESVNKTKTKPNKVVILVSILLLVIVIKRLKTKYKK